MCGFSLNPPPPPPPPKRGSGFAPAFAVCTQVDWCLEIHGKGTCAMQSNTPAVVVVVVVGGGGVSKTQRTQRSLNLVDTCTRSHRNISHTHTTHTHHHHKTSQSGLCKYFLVLGSFVVPFVLPLTRKGQKSDSGKNTRSVCCVFLEKIGILSQRRLINLVHFKFSFSCAFSKVLLCKKKLLTLLITLPQKRHAKSFCELEH